MNKEKKIILIILAVFALLIAIFALLNFNSISNIGSNKIDSTILFKTKDKDYIVGFDLIDKLDSEEFEAVVRSNGKKSKTVMYTAVKLVDILDSLNIDYKSTNKAIVKAEDAYISAVSIDDINIDGNVYIAYKMNGKYLKSRQDGGEGPFQLIIRKDNFSQRWVKYVIEVELQ